MTAIARPTQLLVMTAIAEPVHGFQCVGRVVLRNGDKKYLSTARSCESPLEGKINPPI
jgi:hypothetical protein